MSRIPIEDLCQDVIAKAQRGWKISDEALCARAEISPDELALVQAGQGRAAIIRRIAKQLKLNPSALEGLAAQTWYPEYPTFRHGFMMFNTPYEDMTVNNYVVWDPKSKDAAVFDSGADCGPTLDFIEAESLRVKYIFLTHTHEDHVADLPRLIEATGAQVWVSELEPTCSPGAQTFTENAYFHLGEIAIKTLLTSGHSPGLTSFYITGLSWPLAIVGDSVFAGSIGGSPTHFEEQLRNNIEKLTKLPRPTVFAPGHGPLTTLAQELRYNPFLAR